MYVDVQKALYVPQLFYCIQLFHNQYHDVKICLCVFLISKCFVKFIYNKIYSSRIFVYMFLGIL